MRRSDLGLVVSCEHGGRSIPARYRALFRGHAGVLDSHRGWDPGALELARTIAKTCYAPLLANTVSRLVVECNRSIGHPQLFSEFTRDLDGAEHMRILANVYYPHRRAVEQQVRRALRRHRRVVHISVHTFVPVLHGRKRTADVGLLYDPGRRLEVAVADALLVHLALHAPAFRVRRNYPYRGWTDGFTTALRRRFPGDRYAGLELEVNQALANSELRWRATRSAIADSILKEVF
jgi:predicted N-formylglutamate amidohydrolase